MPVLSHLFEEGPSMLDVMRRANRRKWFVGIIILFVVFAFVVSIFAIWGGAATMGDPTGLGWAARVDGVEIPASELERVRQQMVNDLKQEMGEAFDADAATLAIYRQAAVQLISMELAYAYATRIGLSASDEEVSRAIHQAPVFQRQGRFIGRTEYMNELRSRGYSPEQYEMAMRRELVTLKLRGFVESLVTVTDADVEQAFRERGETAEADHVLFRLADFQGNSTPSEAQVAAWFEEHKGDYMSPERRRASYVLLERAPILASLQVSDDDARRFYEENQARYSSPAQRRASHILFRVERTASPDEAAQVEERAAGVLEQVRGGADFAEMATQHSEDEVTPPGGDLGWFGEGRMVPEFDQAVFSMTDGEVSDLVRTDFGFHIIKMTGAREAGTQPFDEVKDAIKQDLSFRQAQDRMQELASQLRTRLEQQVSSFEATAAELGHTVRDTGLFGREEPLGPLGVQPRAAQEAFQMTVGSVSSALPVSDGLLVMKLEEIRQPEPSPFAEVRDRVREDWIRGQAFARARAAAAAIVSAGFDGFKEAADRKKVTVASHDEFTRATAPSVFNPSILDAIFSADAGRLVGPLDASEGVIVVKVLKRGPATEEDRIAARARLAAELRGEALQSTYQALLQSVARGASIQENEQLWTEIEQRAPRAARSPS
jgi:peptidyl-prolyl cis-trans isomerase D